jgi:hypothetical protein
MAYADICLERDWVTMNNEDTRKQTATCDVVNISTTTNMTLWPVNG